MKYLNFKRFKFSTITKNFNTLRNNFFKFFKSLDLERYDFKKLEKYLNFTRLLKYFNFKNYNLGAIKKVLDLKKYRVFPLYLIASIIFFGFIYVTIPMFYSYEKSVFRNDPKWEIPIKLRKEIQNLPIICDASHIAGKATLIEDIAQTAMDINLDGLMIEAHNNPSLAFPVVLIHFSA